MEIDKISRSVQWNLIEKSSVKMTWQEVCSPKREGGLGIKNIILWNQACMVIHLWDLARKKIMKY